MEVPGIGFVEREVLLSGLQPVQELDLELPEPSVVEVRLSCAPAARSQPTQVGRLYLVGHDLEPRGPRTTRAELDAQLVHEFSPAAFLRQRSHVTSCRFRGRPPRALSLFHEGLLISTRVLTQDESVVEWRLDRDEWPVAPGAIEVSARDARSLAPLNARVRPLGARRYELEVSEPGTTRVHGLQTGWREVSIGHEGHEEQVEWLFVPPGGVAQLETRLRVGVEISGVVVDLDGDVVHREVIATRIDEETGTSVSRTSRARRHGDGGFMFRALRPGRYQLRTLGSDEEAGSSARTSEILTLDASESVTGVRLELRPVGRILLDPIATSALPGKYQLQDHDGRLLRSGWLTTTASKRIEVARGRYRLSVLEGGELTPIWEGRLGAEPLVLRF